MKTANVLAFHRIDLARSLRRMAAAPVSSLMNIFVVAVALLLPALVLLLSLNLANLLAQFQGSSRITLYLHSDVTENRGIEVSEDLLENPDIALAAYISASQALAEFSAAAGFMDVLDEIAINPLPATIIVRPEAASLDAVEALAANLQGLPEVELVQLDSLWLQRLQGIARMLDLLARILGAGAIIGLCFVIGNTIRLAVASRSDEIRVVKLVGGTHGFIARPFLYTGALYGVFGGLLAWLLLLALVAAFSAPLQELARLYDSTFSIAGLTAGNALALVGAGGLTGWIAALLASLRYIADIRA